MAEEEHLNELMNLVWENADRTILVGILAVFGFMILSFASMHAETFTQSDVDSINTVFGILGSLLVAYMVLPWFRYGLENRDTTFGKILAVAAPVSVVLAYVV